MVCEDGLDPEKVTFSTSLTSAQSTVQKSEAMAKEFKCLIISDEGEIGTYNVVMTCPNSTDDLQKRTCEDIDPTELKQLVYVYDQSHQVRISFDSLYHAILCMLLPIQKLALTQGYNVELLKY